MSVTTAIVLDKRREYKKTDNYPVCIRVTFNRDSRRFGIGLFLSEKDFGKLSSPHLGEKLREIRENVKKEAERAKTIIKNLRKFSFDAFSEEFLAFRPGRRKKTVKKSLSLSLEDGHASFPEATGPSAGLPPRGDIKRQNFKNQFGKRKYPVQKSDMDFRSLGEVASHYGVYILKLEAQDRIGTVNCYMCSLMSLLEYRPQLRFSDITELELYRYEKWMEAKGNSVTTISLYIRCLRHIFNVAIAKKLIDRDLYPFGPEKYLIPAGRNIKKAITIDDIQRIYEYQSGDCNKMMYRDFWLFIYLANGMNVKDLTMLKYENIDGRFIRFLRAKTANTSRTNPQLISVYCSEEIQQLIARWGNPDKSPANYIFPILTIGQDAYERRHKIQLFNKMINTYMYEIGAELGIARKLSTMAARHSFSTQLKRTGISVEAIQELLGHKNLKTTINYLDSFEDSSKAQQVENLLPFKKKLHIIEGIQE
jgi:integrase/recombinase XerD